MCYIFNHYFKCITLVTKFILIKHKSETFKNIQPKLGRFILNNNFKKYFEIRILMCFRYLLVTFIVGICRLNLSISLKTT